MTRLSTDSILPLLPVLEAVADSGQVTAAADLLGVPQPTITRALQRAERALGVPVHVKDGRGIRLTPAGEALMPYVREALRAVEAGLSAAGAVAAPVRGRVRVAFQNILGEDLIPALVQASRKDHSEVEFALFQGARAHCMSLLTAGEADFAFVSPPPTEREKTLNELEVVGLGADELVVVVPANHRLAHRATVRLAELAGESMVVMARGFGMRSAVRGLLDGAGVRTTTAFEGQDIHTLVGLVSAGLGITIVPRREYTANIRMLRIAGSRVERYVVMVALRDFPASPAVSAFRELVMARGSTIAATTYAAPRTA